MKLFLLTLAAAYSLVVGVSLWIEHSTAGETSWLVFFFASAWLVPICAAWLAAEALHLFSNRRIFTPNASSPLAATLAGALAGTLGVCLGAVGVALAHDNIPDALVMGAAAAVATLLVVTLCPRIRPGRCARCNYDLNGITTACHGQCPECGAALLA